MEEIQNSPNIEEKPLSSHHALLRAGISLFSKKGFDGTSVKELADHAHVNVSLVSYHFGGKLELYKACLDMFGKERLAAATRILQLPKSKEEFVLRLEMFSDEMLLTHAENKELTQLVHRECELELPRFEDIFRDTFLKQFQTFIQFFVEARALGFMDEKLDPQTVVALYFGALLHIAKSDPINLKYFGQSIRDEEYRKKIVSHLVSIYIKGVSSS